MNDRQLVNACVDVRALRSRLGLTQEAMAARLGVSWATVNRWERGKSRPTGLSLAALRKLGGEK